MIRSWVRGFVLLFLIAGILPAKVVKLKIKHISAEYYYLNGGKAEGLKPGDRLLVRHRGKAIAVIEVEFVALHSASCKVIRQKRALTVGDLAIFSVKKAAPKQKKPKVQAPPKTALKAPVKPKKPRKKRKPFRSSRNDTRIYGNLSMQYYRLDDRGVANRDFNQPTVRFNLTGRKLWGKDFNLRIRSRARYDQRSQSLNSDVPRNEWRNRIYEFSFSYDNPNAQINFQLGRIISNQFSGIGYIDGLLLKLRLSKAARFGLFAGTQPEWQYSRFQTSIQKYGGFLSYETGSYQTQRLQSTIAFAGEYHHSTVSREFVYIRNSYNWRSRFNFFQSAEVDVNRNWRKARAGQSFSLTSLFVSVNFRVNRALNLGLSYDNRKNYRTFETRSILDSLFDDVLRQGLRANINLRVTHTTTFFSNFGVRKRKTDSQSTYSWSAGASQRNLLKTGLFLRGRFSGFSNLTTDGNQVSASVSKYITRQNYLTVGYGRYFYRISLNNDHRSNQWVRTSAFIALPQKTFLSAEVEFNNGNDFKGTRYFLEVGIRF